ncbi:MAG TPA: septum formation initiator family protein [Marmoricola sp.]|jgi:cell division protein FtsB|nr:septum formation initiator family protein [Marmoricola sp.]
MPPNRTPKGRNSRPGTRGSGRVAATQAAPARRPRLTNRAAVLLIVFAVLVVSYASSMRAYLRQQSHIAGLEQQIATAKKAIAEGEREKRRWQDPAYVQAQARERFGWVMPGETAYQVIGRDGRPLSGDDTLTDPATIARPTPDAWWTKAYGTLRAADHPEDFVKPTPIKRINPPKPKAGR